MARIVVVEDHAEIARLIEAILVSREHQVSVFADGLAGLEGIRQGVPDLAILDIGLPGMDGFTLATRLREDAMLRDIPLLFLTALGDIDNRLKGLAIANDYLSKPFDRRELLVRVDTLLRRQAASGSLKGRLELIGGATAAVQLFLLSHAQGAIVFDDNAVLYFSGGRIVHAQHPNLSGADAVERVMLRGRGSFRFDPDVAIPERSLSVEPMRLMLELAKTRDEASQTPPAPVAAAAANAKAAALSPLDRSLPGLTPVPNLVVALTYLETLSGNERFHAREYWDESRGSPCLVLEGQRLRLLINNSSLADIPEGSAALLEH